MDKKQLNEKKNNFFEWNKIREKFVILRVGNFDRVLGKMNFFSFSPLRLEFACESIAHYLFLLFFLLLTLIPTNKNVWNDFGESLHKKAVYTGWSTAGLSICLLLDRWIGW